jgi:hypothetical protein
MYMIYMPYEIKKVGEKYRLWNISKKQYAKPTYKTRQSAKNSANNFMKYEKRKKKKG